MVEGEVLSPASCPTSVLRFLERRLYRDRLLGDANCIPNKRNVFRWAHAACEGKLEHVAFLLTIAAIQDCFDFINIERGSLEITPQMFPSDDFVKLAASMTDLGFDLCDRHP